jgi:hypothetical protein
VNEESTVSRPYTSCDRYDQLVPVPNGDAGGAYERMPMPRGRKLHRPNPRRGRTCGVRSREKQQQLSGTLRSNGKKGKRAKDQQIVIPQIGCILGRGHAHENEGDTKLGIVACQGTDAHWTDGGYDMPGSCIES